MTTHQPPPPPWKIRRLSRSLTPLCLPLPIAFSYLTPWGWTWRWRQQWASLVLPPDLTVKLPGTSTEQGKGSLTLEWCLPASPDSLESTGTTQPSLPLTVSGAPLRSSVSCFIPVVHRRTPYPSPPLQSNCLTLVATWYSTSWFPQTSYMSSPGRVPYQALLIFTSLWSKPSHGRPVTHQTISAHSLPSHIPAPVTLTSSHSPLLSLVLLVLPLCSTMPFGAWTWAAEVAWVASGTRLVWLEQKPLSFPASDSGICSLYFHCVSSY